MAGYETRQLAQKAAKEQTHQSTRYLSCNIIGVDARKRRVILEDQQSGAVISSEIALPTSPIFYIPTKQLFYATLSTGQDDYTTGEITLYDRKWLEPSLFATEDPLSD